MDELNKNKKLRSFMFSFLIFSVLFHTIESTREYIKLITPFLLMVFSFMLVMKIRATKSTKLRNWFLIVLSSIFAVELLFSSIPMFENYEYGESLGLILFGIPIFLMFNWMIIILGGYQIAERLVKNKIAISIFSGIFTLLFSVILEPIALDLDYWSKLNGATSIYFIKWFLIAFIVTHSYQSIKVDINSRFPRYIAATVFVMFVILNVIFSIT